MSNPLSDKFQTLKLHLTSASPLQKKMLGGGMWATVGKASLSASGLVLNIVLARLISPEEIGAYFIAISIISMGGDIVLVGLNQTIVRLIAESISIRHPSRARQAIFHTFIILSISSFLGVCFLMLGGGEWITKTIFNLPALSNINFLLALWALLYTVQTLLAEIFRGFQDIRLASSFGGGGVITRIVLVIILTGVWIYLGYSNIEQIILMTIASYLITTILAGFLVRKHLTTIPFGNGSIKFAEVINITLPLWVSSMGLAFINQVDVWFLGAYHSVGEVAVYGVVLRLALIASTPGLIINAIMPPIITELYTIGEKQQLERTLRSISTILALIASVVFLLFLFFGKSILLLLFGEYYVDGYTALIILTISQLINISIGAAGLTLIMSGFQSTFMKITLLSGLLSLVLLYFFTPLYSYLGVALAIAIAKIFQSIIVLFFTHKKTGLWTHVKPVLLLHPKSLWRSMR